MSRDCIVLFSGGTDSTCAAAICAEKYDRVHLLTFYEHATRRSPLPHDNVSRLRKKYGYDRFVFLTVSTDDLVRSLSYERYLSCLFRFGFFMMSTPGFSSLSWHVRAIAYARNHNIETIYDGMTQELMHLPGHMPKVRDIFVQLYSHFGLRFASPVIDWEIPPDQHVADRLLVDQHGFAPSLEAQARAKTTGAWLFERGLLPRANVKGSELDRGMQHDCYPFVPFNIFAFWLAIPLFGMKGFEQRIECLMAEKAGMARSWIESNSADLFSPEELCLNVSG